jgi:hypothetical protein
MRHSATQRKHNEKSPDSGLETRPVRLPSARALSCSLFLLLLTGCHAQNPTPQAGVTTAAPAPPLWTDAERSACVAFWTTPGRMQVSFAPARPTLTPAASIWFSAFRHALRTASPTDAAAWKDWTDAKFARDRWEAAQVCRPCPQTLYYRSGQ